MEEERKARAARRAGQAACNALGAAARLAGRKAAAGGGAELSQLARDLREEVRALAACICHLPPPTRRQTRRAARARVALARREARLVRRRARRARVAGDDVRERLRALLRRERAARARGGRVGAGARWRGWREGERLARTTEGVLRARAERVEGGVAALMGLLGLLEASSVEESAEAREAAAEDRADEGEIGAGSDKEAPAAVQVQRPRPVQRGRRVLQKGAAEGCRSAGTGFHVRHF